MLSWCSISSQSLFLFETLHSAITYCSELIFPFLPFSDLWASSWPMVHHYKLKVLPFVCHYTALVCAATSQSSIWPFAWGVLFLVHSISAALIRQGSQRGAALRFICPSAGTEEDLGEFFLLWSWYTLCVTGHCSPVLPDPQVPAPKLSSDDSHAKKRWMWQTAFLLSHPPPTPQKGNLKREYSKKQWRQREAESAWGSTAPS